MADRFDGMAEARRRIAEEAVRRTGRLDLRNLGLERLPADLFALTHLRSLDLGADSPLGDERPNAVQADAARLSELAKLEALDLSWSDLADLAPIAGLAALRTLNASGCHLAGLPAALLDHPGLANLVLYRATIPGVPTELLSSGPIESCLAALRAHAADLAAGGAVPGDARLLLLGNGLVGKTQIARWLRGEGYDPRVPSTHGIQLGAMALPGAGRVQIWDFGGQDIYHGTHALFLRNPAVIAPAWARGREPDAVATYALDGLAFRNHPLAYWAHLVRHQRHPASPVLFLQAQCDTPEAEAHPFPIPPGTLGALPYKRQIHVSAKEDRGGEELRVAIRAAIAWMRAPDRMGVPLVGAGRLRVQRRLEALRDAEAGLPPEERRHRWIERDSFEAICAEEGGITSTDHCLAWLDATGVVFHRPGLFGDRVILDLDWALGAIYAVFDRAGCYRQIVANRGRFSRWLLAQTTWRAHGEGEQRLLLGMMRSCGMCFRHRAAGRSGEDDPHDEYIAPDLLPAREDVAATLPGRWDEDAPAEVAEFRYPLLHAGLIRGIMAKIGERAGADALYWKDGLCGFEAATGSRLLIEQQAGEGWGGTLTLRTQRGQAAALLEEVVRLVEHVQSGIGLAPERMERRAAPPPPRADAPQSLRFTQEKPAMPEWYVSYAWGDDRTPAGMERERVVDDLCARAKAEGKPIHRDREVLRHGDSISAFMRRIGAGDRVFVFLSEKYLRSPFCLFELSEVWRHSRQDEHAFRDRVRLYTLDDADIRSPLARARHAAHWRKQHDEMEAFVRDNGGPTLLGERDFQAFKKMGEFYRHIGDMLATLADTVQPRSFDDFIRYGFAAPPPP